MKAISACYFFSLITNLYTNTPTRLSAAVIMSATIAAVYLPSPSALPPMVEVMAEGMRPSEQISNHTESFISVSPAKYASKSFGVPGTVKISAKISVRLGDVCRILSASVFFYGKNTSTAVLPNFRTKRKTETLPAKAPMR